MSVISEETAKRAGLKVNPYDNSNIRVITADGKEVPDVQGYVEADVTLDNYRLKGVRMIVFKRATNPCLIGRGVLSIHPSTQDHFLAMIGLRYKQHYQSITMTKETAFRWNARTTKTKISHHTKPKLRKLLRESA